MRGGVSGCADVLRCTDLRVDEVNDVAVVLEQVDLLDGGDVPHRQFIQRCL